MPKPVILCVDDENFILMSLKTQIKKALNLLCNVETAESGNEALEIVKELYDDGIDVVIVISDWLMPGMKGDEFLVRLHQSHPNIIKVMLSGQTDQDAIERAKDEADLFQFIYKPWESRELINMLKSILNEA